MADRETIAKTIGAVAEVVGHELSPMALKLMVRDLERYPQEQVVGALHRCARECRHKLLLADILDRLDDGRPGVEEAWAAIPRDEATSVVMTDEMAAAFGVALPLLEDGDPVQARMAFKEAYTREVQQARDAGKPVHWFASLGHDKAGREGVLQEAVRKGRLSLQQAQKLMPHMEVPESLKQLASNTAKALASQACGRR